MDDAYVSHMTSEACINIPERIGYAAELRAIAEWLVPEDTEPKRTLNVEPERDVTFIGAWHIWNTRRQLRRKLLTEADRAEDVND